MGLSVHWITAEAGWAGLVWWLLSWLLVLILTDWLRCGRVHLSHSTATKYCTHKTTQLIIMRTSNCNKWEFHPYLNRWVSLTLSPLGLLLKTDGAWNTSCSLMVYTEMWKSLLWVYFQSYTRPTVLQSQATLSTRRGTDRVSGDPAKVIGQCTAVSSGGCRGQWGEIESREAGSGVMLPEDRVNPSVSGIVSFLGLRALLLIISSGVPPGLRGAAGREPWVLALNFFPGEAEPSSPRHFLAFIFLAAPSCPGTAKVVSGLWESEE